MRQIAFALVFPLASYFVGVQIACSEPVRWACSYRGFGKDYKPVVFQIAVDGDRVVSNSMRFHPDKWRVVTNDQQSLIVAKGDSEQLEGQKASSFVFVLVLNKKTGDLAYVHGSTNDSAGGSDGSCQVVNN